MDFTNDYKGARIQGLVTPGTPSGYSWRAW